MRILLLLTAVLAAQALYAQKITVKGKLVDSSGSPLPMATKPLALNSSARALVREARRVERREEEASRATQARAAPQVLARSAAARTVSERRTALRCPAPTAVRPPMQLAMLVEVRPLRAPTCPMAAVKPRPHSPRTVPMPRSAGQAPIGLFVTRRTALPRSLVRSASAASLIDS